MTAVQNKIKQVTGNINNISLLVIDCNTLTKETFFSYLAKQFEKLEKSRQRAGWRLQQLEINNKILFLKPVFFYIFIFCENTVESEQEKPVKSV